MAIGQGKTISIIGAGVAGLSAACALGRLGYRVNVYEQSIEPSPSRGQAADGAILLTDRSLAVLDHLGAGEAVRRAGLRVTRQLLQSAPARGPSRAPRESLDVSGLAIGPAELRRALLSAATAFDHVEMYFGQRCTEADAHAGSLRIVAEQGEDGAASDGFIASSLIIGADGPHSVLRRALQLAPGFTFSQSYGPSATRRAVLPGAHSPPQMRAAGAGACRVFAGGGFVITALPHPDGSLTCTLHGPARGPMGLEVIRSAPAAEALLRACAPELLSPHPTLAAALAESALERSMTVRCTPWVHQTGSGAGLALIGDAAHGSDAIFGLCAGSAIEDAGALGTCIERAGGDIGAALAEFDTQRRPEAEGTLGSMAAVMAGFSSRTDSRLVHARLGLEHVLADMFPLALAPRASMLAATGALARQQQRRSERLDRVLRALVVAGLIIVLFVLVLVRVPAWPLMVAVVLGAWALFEFARRDQGAHRPG